MAADKWRNGLKHILYIKLMKEDEMNCETHQQHWSVAYTSP